MKQRLFFEEAVKLVKLVWSGIVISSLCISVSMMTSSVFWLGICIGIAIGLKTLSVYAKKSKLINGDYYALLPHPFRASSGVSLIVSFVIAIVSEAGFFNPWAMGFLVAAILFAAAKTIEPNFGWWTTKKSVTYCGRFFIVKPIFA